MPLLTTNQHGIYCPQADVYIDPWRPVARALITHGHSDHARWGHQHYACTPLSAPILQKRLGQIDITTYRYGETFTINGVEFSFHPAGHIPGSAQIRVAYKGEVWVVSGDYKLHSDGISTPFEPVRCHTFITESTFGLPVFRWPTQQEVADDLNNWWRHNQAQGITSVVAAYALGKAQRILSLLDPTIGSILVHGAVDEMNQSLEIPLPAVTRVTADMAKEQINGAIVITPPAALGSSWMKRFTPYATAMASGWMQMRGTRRRRAVDKGFVMSDHADWQELNAAIRATGAEQVLVTHGYSDIYSQWLREQGLDAHPLATAYEGEQADSKEEVEG